MFKFYLAIQTRWIQYKQRPPQRGVLHTTYTIYQHIVFSTMSLACSVALLFVGALIPKGEIFHRTALLPVVGIAACYGKWVEVLGPV